MTSSSSEKKTDIQDIYDYATEMANSKDAADRVWGASMLKSIYKYGEELLRIHKLDWMQPVDTEQVEKLKKLQERIKKEIEDI